jgi:hypothetical protein
MSSYTLRFNYPGSFYMDEKIKKITKNERKAENNPKALQKIGKKVVSFDKIMKKKK